MNSKKIEKWIELLDMLCKKEKLAANHSRKEGVSTPGDINEYY